MPCPTWPNRFFAHAASSAGLDDSPPALRSTTAVFAGYRFANGTIFDRLSGAGREWCVVEGGALPVSLAIQGMVQHSVAGRLITIDELKERLGADSSRRPTFSSSPTTDTFFWTAATSSVATRSTRSTT